MTEREELREAIANLVPLSLVDGRDQRNVLDVADQIMEYLERRGITLPQPTKQVTYNHGGSAMWTAVEKYPGFWTVLGWNMPVQKSEDFWKEFTEVEETS